MSSVPFQALTLKKSDLDDPSLAVLNQWLTGATNRINALSGHAGPITLNNHLNLNGNRITNLGEAQSATDAVSQAFGSLNYGPAAIQPNIEAMGNNVLQTTRQLGSKFQREPNSSFLNSIPSSPPATNTSTVTFGSPSGGFIPVTISAGLFQRVDGSFAPYAAYNDSLPQPATYALTSLVRSGNIVTVTTSVTNPFTAGETIAESGVTDPTFDGSFYITTIVTPGSVYQYQQFAASASTTGGTASLGSVYYYWLRTETSVLGRSGPFAADTLQNRISSSIDGQVIIAVAVINGSAGDNTQSAAGATPPAQTNGNRLLLRL